MGQACHFNRYSPEPAPYGAWRMTAECRRLNHVLDKQLVSFISASYRTLHTRESVLSNTHLAQSVHPFVAGERLTIADIAVFIFAHSALWCGVDISEFPHVKAWIEKLLQRPAFQQGLKNPAPYPFSDEAVANPDAQDFYKNMRKMGGQFIKNSTEEWKGEVPALPSDHANF